MLARRRPKRCTSLQVIGFDFRGHGKSDKPHDFKAYGTENLASDVIAVLDHLGLNRTSLIAYSIGTAVALHLLRSSPGRFERAALRAFAKASYPPLSVEDASSIHTPTLVVSGENDPVLGRGPRLADALAHGEYLEIAGADHFSLATDTGTRATVASHLTSASDGPSR